MNQQDRENAEALLRGFKGDSYAFGSNALQRVGDYTSKLGKRVAIICDVFVTHVMDPVKASIQAKGGTITEVFDGARANAPREDVYRLAYQLSQSEWDCVVAIGGGSTIDSAKAALALTLYGGVIDNYFGTGRVSEKSRGQQIPLIAVQTASSTGAHLTKYANITDVITHQKKLIVDDSIVPLASVFQYDVTITQPQSLTKDGGLDGISHCWEVWMGATNAPYYEKISEIAQLGIKIIVENLSKAYNEPTNLDVRYALGLGTDLGGYAIMVGGTNAGHLGSFTLTDILSHGRACAILNPYYAILFSSVIQDQLKNVAKIFRDAGFITKSVTNLKGRELAESVFEGMTTLSTNINFPTTLKAAGATQSHLEKMLEAAKDPQLKMKLQNMPVPMDVAAGDIDKYMAPTLEAALIGDISKIPEMS